MFDQENTKRFQNVWGPTYETSGQQCVECKTIVHSAKEMAEHKCPESTAADVEVEK